MKSHFSSKYIPLFVLDWLLHLHCTRIWAGPWENVSYVISEQQRRRSACASAQSDQCLCCSLLRWYNISRLYCRDFETLASFFCWAGMFESDLVGHSRRHILSCRGCFVAHDLNCPSRDRIPSSIQRCKNHNFVNTTLDIVATWIWQWYNIVW